MIDETRALELLTAVVLEKGEDTVYCSPIKSGEFWDRCVYWYEDGPSCLVGQALWMSGEFQADELKEMDGRMTPVVAGNLATEFPSRVTEYGAAILQAAQSAQDGLRPWGEALEMAQKEMVFVKQCRATMESRDV